MARFFDGAVSDPRSVELCVRNQKLWLRDLATGEEVLLPWVHLRTVQKIAGEWRLEIAGDRLILAPDGPEMVEIFRIWQSQQRGLRKVFSAWSAQPYWRQIGLGLLLIAVLAGFFMLGSRHAWRLIPIRYDRYIGEKVHTQLTGFFEPCTVAALEEFHSKAAEVLRDPGDRFTHQITVLNHPMANALALPGGRLYVFRGLLELSESPDEVLGVLAHEMAHTERRHGVQQLLRSLGMAFMISLMIGAPVEGLEAVQYAETLSEIGSTLLFLQYARDFEREADAQGLERLRRAQLPILGLGNLLVRLETRDGAGKIALEARDSTWEFLSTHPRTLERLRHYEEAENAQPDPETLNPRFSEERQLWHLIKNACPEARNPLGRSWGLY